MTDDNRDLEYMRDANTALVERPVFVMFERMFQKDWGDDFYEDAQKHLDNIRAQVDAVWELMYALEPSEDARAHLRRWREDMERKELGWREIL